MNSDVCVDLEKDGIDDVVVDDVVVKDVVGKDVVVEDVVVENKVVDVDGDAVGSCTGSKRWTLRAKFKNNYEF